MLYRLNYNFIHEVTLKAEIESALSVVITSVTQTLEGIEVEGPEGLDQVYMQSIVDTHVHPGKAQVLPIIKAARAFGETLMEDFATENVLMGITQAGKTGAASDFLANIARNISTGSLYEVVKEIDRKVLLGLPSDLSPFITEARMILIKNKIMEYLS